MINTLQASILQEQMHRFEQFGERLERARKAIYYDEAADALDRDRYYSGLSIDSLDARKCYQALSALVSKNTRALTYSDARHMHLYPNVDLHPNGMLKSIYTGQSFSPESVIQSDLDISANLLKALMDQSATQSPDELSFNEQLDALEAAATFNAEHSVPQSWFDKQDPMRADLHHLFTCDIPCNEFRANLPFYDFNPGEGRPKTGCGVMADLKFEPVQGKGAVARATMYFLLRYPGKINNNVREYTPDDLPTLLRWHAEEPPEEYEWHRNAEIFRVQGNRNPLIDHPEWSDRIDFLQGLG